jgi:hypothetical protein
MAAVICQSIGDLCRGCGEIMCLPCKACGIGCQCLWDIASSPFFPYMFVTFALNIAPVALGIQSVPDLGGGCTDLATWMLVNGIFCLIHMVACLYIVHKVQEENQNSLQKPFAPGGPAPTTTTTTTVTSASVYDTESKKETVTATATPVQNLESGTYYYRNMSPDDDAAPGNTWGRIKHVMCYDKGVALYIIIAIAWIFYQTVGVTKYVTQSGDCGDIGTRMLGSVFCGWFYMSLVGFAFFCSMCCMRL